MPKTSKQKTEKIRAKRMKIGQKRREFSLTDDEFKKAKGFISNLRK